MAREAACMMLILPGVATNYKRIPLGVGFLEALVARLERPLIHEGPVTVGLLVGVPLQGCAAGIDRNHPQDLALYVYDRVSVLLNADLQDQLALDISHIAVDLLIS